MTINVLIAESRPAVRAGFRRTLEREPDIGVVAEVPDGRAALESAVRLRPDVCLLDAHMAGPDGIEVTRRLAARRGVAGAPRTVVVAPKGRDEAVLEALRAGASGFLLRDTSPALLVEAVRAADAGEMLLSPAVTARVLEGLPGRRSASGRGHGLSERELDVVRRVALGATSNEIAADLHLAPSTVKSHLARVQKKLGARNRVEVAAWAWRRGLMTAG
ncbi:response regulator transcription factor [Streptomyces sp. ACA25]|uniref:response regulator n=1 Tax=Streptomyces sp. ACA25 TaxID=3022596 RepID=UPI002307182C|nr:response regulator transcription factor [Streptomyces sp. ACA25]MDB1086081.1 response regulator transcription factor [Streptomyces sp. ACA25]